MTPLWYQIAKAELGVREVPGPEFNPRIVAYHEATTLKATSDEVPWCSAFVCWALERANVESTHSASARSYLHWGTPITHPPLGAIVVMSRGGDPSQGHVGFLTEVTTGKVYVLGGNQADTVSVAIFDSSRVLSYRWPS